MSKRWRHFRCSDSTGYGNWKRTTARCASAAASAAALDVDLAERIVLDDLNQLSLEQLEYRKKGHDNAGAKRIEANLFVKTRREVIDRHAVKRMSAVKRAVKSPASDGTTAPGSRRPKR